MQKKTYLCSVLENVCENTMKNKLFLAVLLSVFTIPSLLYSNPKREMRATWLTTVANIDWPISYTTDIEGQKKELRGLLDACVEFNLNTVMFHIRPACDALYKSSYEPWSSYLNHGRGVDPGYDPLQFCIEECHLRGLECHGWINPYRYNERGGYDWTGNDDTTQLNYKHTHPEWLLYYKNDIILDPALPEVRQRIKEVVGDIINNYDLDGLLMDDYFYPYPVSGQEFPDAEAFAADPRGFDNVGDWRRDNVNLAIEQVHNTIMSIKPHVQFGISPFGIWRNKANDPRGSETNGLQNYDQLYADILLWMEKGWIDYVVPQLYWEIGKKVADYKTLAYWWAQHATDKCRVYIGMAPYHMGNPKMAAAWNEGNEICRQLRLNRSIPGITGECYFPANVILKNHHNIADSLKQVFYPTYVSAPRK